MMTDLRFALRQIRKSPGFTLLAVITLTLGIGLNTAIFSLINDLFLKGLPFREPARVLHVFSHFREQTVDFPISAPRLRLSLESWVSYDASMPGLPTLLMAMFGTESLPWNVSGI